MAGRTFGPSVGVGGTIDPMRIARFLLDPRDGPGEVGYRRIDVLLGVVMILVLPLVLFAVALEGPGILFANRLLGVFALVGVLVLVFAKHRWTYVGTAFCFVATRCLFGLFFGSHRLEMFLGMILFGTIGIGLIYSSSMRSRR